jgi:hypothetical protein
MPATVGILACLATAAQADSGRRLAQSSQAEVSVPSTIAVQPATQVRLPIRVGPQGAVPRNSFIRLRGLPPSVSLTEGYSIGPGSWAVPLFALPSLQIVVPSTAVGPAAITVTLVSADGAVLAETRTSIVGVTSAPGVTAAPERRPGNPVQLLPPEEREQGRKLVAQGERYLSMGNFPVARQFFERAADIGYAPGALQLAATFDPIELARLGARGVVPNAAEARKWYERARELGAAEATDRLARLTRN